MSSDIVVIPTHGLIVVIGPDKASRASVLSLFPASELETPCNMIRSVSNLNFINDLFVTDITRRVGEQLRNGARVVIEQSPIWRPDERRNLLNLARDLSVPIFYIICDNGALDRKFRSQERNIRSGDGMARCIDTQYDRYHVVSREENTLNDIKSHFSGLTIIPDIHGNLAECNAAIKWARSRNHYSIFLGDVIDYGHDNIKVIDAVHSVCASGQGEFIIGNHERKIFRYIKQPERTARLSEGNKITAKEFDNLSKREKTRWTAVFSSLMAGAHINRDIGSFVFAHAAIPRSYWADKTLTEDSERFCLFGEYGSSDNRSYEWVNYIPANRTVIVGHDIRSKASPFEAINKNGGKAIFMDTGSGKGGKLTTVDLRFHGDDLSLMNYNFHQ
jgi:hypothetical protein